MKTNQFIKEIKSMGFRVEDSESSIYIFDSNDYYVARLSKNGVGEVSTDFSGFTDLEYSIKLQLLNLLIEYAKTPIEDREEEEKYYLKLRGIGGRSFLNARIDYSEYFIENNKQVSGNFITQFTQSEIDDMPECYTHPAVWKQVEVESEEEC